MGATNDDVNQFLGKVVAVYGAKADNNALPYRLMQFPIPLRFRRVG
jgi:hypothetical protein